jgi:hypothetical protein
MRPDSGVKCGPRISNEPVPRLDPVFPGLQAAAPDLLLRSAGRPEAVAAPCVVVVVAAVAAAGEEVAAVDGRCLDYGGTEGRTMISSRGVPLRYLPMGCSLHSGAIENLHKNLLSRESG